VLRVLRELKKVKLSEIQGELEKRGFRWTKQYTQKILKKLEEKGLARKISRGRYIAS
jgi:repressor of nif and glnA expression